MADTRDGQDGRTGRFRLGRRCQHAAVELGAIHEAVHADTGAPALLMTPGARTSGWPRSAWRLSIHVQLVPPRIGLVVEQGPYLGRLTELLDVLCLMLAALEAVKHDARVRTHLASARLGRRPWPYLPHVIAGISLGFLIMGLWLSLGKHGDVSLLPAGPLEDQARAPCLPDLAEVELNGGCWMELSSRAPCPKAAAEYQGRCYTPVARKRPLRPSETP